MTTTLLTSTRALRRALLTSALVVAGLTIAPAVAHADATPMTAAGGVFTGTSGDDVLIIQSEGTYLTHNRFALGDPGFAGKTDFDSTVAGFQTRQMTESDRFSFNALEGNDILKLNGAMRNTVIGTFDMGPGTDKIDAISASDGIYLGFGTDEHMETVEVVAGSAKADVVYANANGAVRTAPISIYGRGGGDIIQGTDMADMIDGGGGDNTITGLAGNDFIAVAAPLPPNLVLIEGGLGTDMLVVSGTNNADVFGLMGSPGLFEAFDYKDIDGGGYRAVEFERARLSLLGGDDGAFVSTTLPIVGVLGGAGTDDVVVDVMEATAKVDTSNAVAKITIPQSYGNVTRAPLTVNIDSEVESFALANETVIATSPGPGGGPHVRTFKTDGTEIIGFYAYNPAFTGGVNLALGDLNGDVDDDIITAAGPGGGPHVRVFYSDGSDSGVSFYAYEPNFNGGIDVAAIDLNGDGIDEIVTVPAKDRAPLVRVFTGDGQLVTEFLATGFGNHGLHVARGAQMGLAGGEQIMVSSAEGTPAVVRVYEMSGYLAAQYKPYSPYGSFAGGAPIARGQFRGQESAVGTDSHDEIVTGAGRGGGPQVVVAERQWDGSVKPIGSFFAYSASFTGGVEVATCNADGGNDEIVTVPGAGVAPLVRTFGMDGNLKRKSFLAYDAAFTSGIHVACGGSMYRGYSS